MQMNAPKRKHLGQLPSPKATKQSPQVLKGLNGQRPIAHISESPAQRVLAPFTSHDMVKSLTPLFVSLAWVARPHGRARTLGPLGRRRPRRQLRPAILHTTLCVFVRQICSDGASKPKFRSRPKPMFHMSCVSRRPFAAFGDAARSNHSRLRGGGGALERRSRRPRVRSGV